MFNWFNMKKKTLPQQVLENTDNIEKLFDNELADITQLNFKQDEEESLVYENGVAKFKGKTTIIRDENAENVSVSSEMEFKVSSGDDDVVIDAGEDNSTLEIHLDNETRNKINRALLTPLSTPSERQFVGVDTNNSEVLIPESELNDKINSKEIVYTYQNTISINDSILTTLQGYFDLFNQDINAIYHVLLGALVNTNFKNLVGNPAGFGNYIDTFIKLVNKGDSGYLYRTYELLAIDNYGEKIAKAYIYKNLNYEIVVTGWTILGGE